MENDNYKDKLESFFEQSLKQYGEDPSDALWDRLEQNIPSKPKRRIPLFIMWSAAAAGVLVLLTFAWSRYNDRMNELNAQIVKQEVEIEKLLKQIDEKENVSNEETMALIESNEAFTNEQENNNSYVEEKVSKTENIAQEKTFSNSKKPNLNSKTKLSKVAANNIQTQHRIPSNTFEFEEVSVINKTEDTPKFESSKSSKDEIALEQASNKDDQALTDSAPQSEPLKYFSSFALIPGIDIDLIEQEEMNYAWENVVVPLAIKSSPWSVSAFYQMQGNLDLNFAFARSQDDFSALEIFDPNRDSLVAGTNNVLNVSENSTSAFSFGILPAFQFNKNWRVETGIGRKIYKESFTSTGSTTVDLSAVTLGDLTTVDLNVNPYSALGNSSLETTLPIETNQNQAGLSTAGFDLLIDRNINYWHIPVKLTFTSAAPKWRLAASAELGYNISPNVNTIISSRSLAGVNLDNNAASSYTKLSSESNLTDSANIRNSFLESAIAVGLEYQVAKKWSIILQPEVRVLFLNAYSARASNQSLSNNISGENVLNYGINGRLSYRF